MIPKNVSKTKEKLYTQLINEAIEYHYHFISVADVDRLNVYQASRLAMLKCLAAFKNPVDAVLTDAMPLEVPYFCLDLIKGDQKVLPLRPQVLWQRSLGTAIWKKWISFIHNMALKAQGLCH